MTAHKTDEVEKNWKNTWKDIILNNDGTIDLHQVKRVLSDFSDLLHKHNLFVEYATGGLLSRTNYTIESLRSAHDFYVERLIEQAQYPEIEDEDFGTLP